MAQELLTTFSEEINELSLQPSDSGLFRVIVNDITVLDRKEMNGFPEIKRAISFRKLKVKRNEGRSMARKSWGLSHSLLSL